MRNYNVVLTNFFTFFDGLAMGMWNYAILGPYLYALCKDNKHAGYAEGLQGTLQALAALPAGYFADRLRRDTVLRGSAAVGLAGVAVTLAGLLGVCAAWWDTYLILCAGLGLLGVYMGMWSPPLYALYADSVPTGQRSRYEVYRYVLSIVSLASGPITNIALFSYMGDEWGMKQMTVIFAVGIGLHVISIAALAFFDDDKSLVPAQHVPVCEQSEETEETEEGVQAVEAVWGLHVGMVPYLVGASDVVFGLASGMTIKFFPVYFAQVLHLSPITVNILFVLDPLTEVLLTVLAQRVSTQAGRVPVCLTLKGAGIALLVCMALCPGHWEAHPLQLCAVYVLRSALVNCTVPLTRSILMDHVAPHARARWNALESVAAFGWSGSAVAGGLLVDAYGFQVSFVATACVQGLAWAPLLLLLPLVAREEALHKGGVRAPLLS